MLIKTRKPLKEHYSKPLFKSVECLTRNCVVLKFVDRAQSQDFSLKTLTRTEKYPLIVFYKIKEMKAYLRKQYSWFPFCSRLTEILLL